MLYNKGDTLFYTAKEQQKYPSLCEIPRWPKLRCPTGWILIMNRRMCVKVFEERVTFSTALTKCRALNANIAATNGISYLFTSKSIFLNPIIILLLQFFFFSFEETKCNQRHKWLLSRPHEARTRRRN